MGPDVKIKHLMALAMLAKVGSFTHAAQALCITQSTLSKQIKELEAQAEVRLFERTTRSLSPTPAGMIMIEASTRILSNLQQAIRDARNLELGSQSHLRIAATPHIAESLLPDVLANFMRATSSTALSFYDGLTTDMMRYVRDGDAEVFITAFLSNEAMLPGLVVDTLFESTVEMVVVFRSGHEFGGHATIEWSELSQERIILLRPDKQVHTTFDIMLQMRRITFPDTIEVSSFGAAIGMVKAGLGVAVFPRGAVEESTVLETCPLRDAQHLRCIFAIHREDQPLTPVAAQFLEVLRNELASESLMIATRPPLVSDLT